MFFTPLNRILLSSLHQSQLLCNQQPLISNSVEGGPYLRYNDAPINKWYYQNEDLSIYSSGSGKFQCFGYLCFGVWVYCLVFVGMGLGSWGLGWFGKLGVLELGVLLYVVVGPLNYPHIFSKPISSSAKTTILYSQTYGMGRGNIKSTIV